MSHVTRIVYWFLAHSSFVIFKSCLMRACGCGSADIRYTQKVQIIFTSRKMIFFDVEHVVWSVNSALSAEQLHVCVMNQATVFIFKHTKIQSSKAQHSAQSYLLIALVNAALCEAYSVSPRAERACCAALFTCATQPFFESLKRALSTTMTATVTCASLLHMSAD